MITYASSSSADGAYYEPMVRWTRQVYAVEVRPVRRAVWWVIAVLVSAGALALVWWLGEGVFGLDREAALTLAAVAASAGAPFALRASRADPAPLWTSTPRHQQRGPIMVGVVPNAADCFQHREITDGAYISLNSYGQLAPVLVLSGLAGAGKTQIAAEISRRVWTRRDADAVVWISAGSREAIQAGYAQAGVALAAADAGDAEQAARLFQSWMSTTAQRWLIVFDDLAIPADLAQLWPPDTAHGRVVVTTRRRDAILSGTGRQLMSVGLFTADEAGRYLAAKLGGAPELLAEADGLAQDLGLLPLAMAQAAAYIADR